MTLHLDKLLEYPEPFECPTVGKCHSSCEYHGLGDYSSHLAFVLLCIKEHVGSSDAKRPCPSKRPVERGILWMPHESGAGTDHILSSCSSRLRPSILLEIRQHPLELFRWQHLYIVYDK